MAKPSCEGFSRQLNAEFAAIEEGRPSRVGFSKFIHSRRGGTTDKETKELSPTLWANWRSGKVLPREGYRLLLAEYISSMTGESSEAILRRLDKAAIASDSSTLRVGRVNHPPYSSIDEPPSALLDRVFGRFIKLDRRKAMWVVNDGKPQQSGEPDAIQALLDQTAEVAIGFFDTIQRSPRIHSFHSPLRTTFNAVIRVEAVEAMESIRSMQEAFVHPEKAKTLLDGWKVLVLHNGIGKRYLEEIDFPMELIDTVSTMHAEAYATVLQNRPRTIAFGDELTMLRLTASLNQSEYPAALLFPLTTMRSAQNSEFKRQLPGFIVGLASVSRANTELIHELDRGLRLMLETDRYAITNLLQLAYEDSVKLIESHLKSMDRHLLMAWVSNIQQETSEDPDKIVSAIAHRATRYMMRLTSDDHADGLVDLNLPWRHIMTIFRRKLGPMPEGTREPSENGFSLEYRPFHFLVCDPGLRAPTQDQPLQDFGLLGEILSAFQATVNSPRRIDRLVKDQSFESSADIRIGTLRSFERMKDWRYFGLPLRIPYDAIFSGLTFNAAQIVAQLDKGRLPDDARAIVLRNGSVRELLRYQVCIDPSMVSEVERLNPKDFLSQIIDPRLKPGIILVDLLTSLEILNDASKSDASHLQSVIRDQSPEETIKWLEQAPCLHIGVAVNRNRPQWITYFSEAFPLLAVECNHFLVRILGRHYHKLLLELEKSLANKQAARAIANFIFHLDGSESEEFGDWRSVLLRLKQEISQ